MATRFMFPEFLNGIQLEEEQKKGAALSMTTETMETHIIRIRYAGTVRVVEFAYVWRASTTP